MIERHFPALEVRLVGSAAAGVAGRNSDVDLTLVPRAEEWSGDGVTEATLRRLGELLESECAFFSQRLPRIRSTAAAATSLPVPYLPPASRMGPIPGVQRALVCVPIRCAMSGVAVVVTRSKAPSLVQSVDRASGIECDLAYRRGSRGAFAGVDKCALLRSFGAASPCFQPLVQLVKRWAKARRLVDPSDGKLNSFTFTLMVARRCLLFVLRPPTRFERSNAWGAHVAVCVQNVHEARLCF